MKIAKQYIYSLKLISILVFFISGSNANYLFSQVILEENLSQISVEAIEAIQSIQDLSQSVPLIAKKRTLIRVYLNYHGPIAISVKAELSVYKHKTDQWINLNSLNAIDVNPETNGKLLYKRIELNESLNFELTPELLEEGLYTFALGNVSKSDSGKILLCPNCANISLTKKMEEVPPLSIRVIGLKYSKTYRRSRTYYEPREIDFNLIKSWISRAYPVGEVNCSFNTVDATTQWPFTCDQVNAQLAAIRNLEINSGVDKKTRYYGLIADGDGLNFMRGCAVDISDDSVIFLASGPTGVPKNDFSWDTDDSYGDWYAGHEIGHTFGRMHPGFCDQSQDDYQYPFKDGLISEDHSSFVALDIGDTLLSIPMRISNSDWHDVMTYCSNQWLSNYTYLSIMDRIISEKLNRFEFSDTRQNRMEIVPRDSLNKETPSYRSNSYQSLFELRVINNEFINITGHINLSQGSGKLIIVNRLSGGNTSPEVLKSRVMIRLKDKDNNVLLSFNPQIGINSEINAQTDTTGIIDCIVPYEIGTQKIELLVNNQIVDTRSVTKSTPIVSSFKTTEDEEGNVNLSWKASDPDSKQLLYHVMYSDDDGESWKTIIFNSKNTEFTVNKSQFDHLTKPLFRVIATDGFNNKIIHQDSIIFK